MVRTVLYAAYFGIILILSQFFILLPYFLLRWTGLKRASKSFIRGGATIMARLVIGGIGAKVRVHGEEHIPADTRQLCLVANHQGLFDIPLIIGYLPIHAGFIAKEELGKVPLLNNWLSAVGCILINRKSPHSAVQAIRNGVEKIKAGQTICIFPEGTRSRSAQMGRFKPGSLKLAYRSNAVIVPVSIKNSYALFEEKNRIRPVQVDIYVHPPQDSSDIDESIQKSFADKLQQIIAEPLNSET